MQFFFHDYQAKFDAEIEKHAERLKAMRTATGESPVQRRLRPLAKPV